MLVQNGSTDGTSESLTVDSARDVFLGLISGDSEDTKSKEPQAGEDEREGAPDDQPDESDETEQVDPSEETDTPDEDADEDSPAPETYRLKINGEEVEVTRDELLKGYSRTSDYTRKTQELAEQRKAVEAENQQARGVRQQYAADLSKLKTALESYAPATPDWDTLRKENPTEFAAAWAEHQQYQQRLAAVEAEQGRVAQEELKVRVAEHQTRLAAEKEALLKAVPEWKDEKVSSKERAELVAYAKEIGFSQEELASVADHRALVMLRKAMLFDRAQAAKPNVRDKIEKVTVVRPGTPRKVPSREVTEITRSKQRLAKTGSVDDAAGVFLNLITASRKAKR